MKLQEILTHEKFSREHNLGVFALLVLGILDSLVYGQIDTTDAIRLFFHVDNALYVRRYLKSKAAEEIMSRGVQLDDIFEILPPAESNRQFQLEVARMRTVCQKLINRKRLVA